MSSQSINSFGSEKRFRPNTLYNVTARPMGLIFSLFHGNFVSYVFAVQTAKHHNEHGFSPFLFFNVLDY
jgi:hypothetical protein